MGLTFFAGGSLLAAAFTTSLGTAPAPLTDIAAHAPAPAVATAPEANAVLAGFNLLEFLRGGGKPRTPALAPDNADENRRFRDRPAIPAASPPVPAPNLPAVPMPPTGLGVPPAPVL